MDNKEKIDVVTERFNKYLTKIGEAIGTISGTDLPIVAAALKQYADAYEKQCIKADERFPGTYEVYKHCVVLMSLFGKTIDMETEEGRAEFIADMLRGMQDD